MMTTGLLVIAVDGCIDGPRGTFAAGSERRMQKASNVNPADARLGALMAAAQAGDRSAYTNLLRECVPFVRAIAARRAPADRIDDVVQDTLLTLHRARQTYDARRSFMAWLGTLADRRAVDIMRRVAREAAREIHAPLLYEQHADDSADQGRSDDRHAAALVVGRAVATLPDRQQEAVRHLMLEEQSLAAAARQTGRSEGALKVNLHRALKALRTKLARDSA